jgi:hypothetical protein
MVHCLPFCCHCSTLHVSAYMAIFRSIWCFTFIFLKESASLLLLPFLARGYTMHIFICVLLFCFFVSFMILVCVILPACLFFLSAARRRQHNLKTYGIQLLVLWQYGTIFQNLQIVFYWPLNKSFVQCSSARSENNVYSSSITITITSKEHFQFILLIILSIKSSVLYINPSGV